MDNGNFIQNQGRPQGQGLPPPQNNMNRRLVELVSNDNQIEPFWRTLQEFARFCCVTYWLHTVNGNANWSIPVNIPLRLLRGLHRLREQPPTPPRSVIIVISFS